MSFASPRKAPPRHAGLNAARRTRDILRNSYNILAFELICACQAADIRGVEQLSSATKKLHGLVREKVPFLDHDEPLTDHIEGLAALFATGKFLEALPENIAGYDW